jgi:glycosyltransferase involved in cell wall biosynthesis
MRGLAKRAYLGWIFRRSAAYLCIGAANRAYYLAHGVAPDRLFAMPYAVDNEFFRDRAAAAAPSREALRAGLGLDPGRPVILFAGKLQRRKNPLALLDAFRLLDRARLRQPYLVFVGDGEKRAEIERAAAADTDIRFLGFRDQTELPALYDLADVFVLASRGEPWGLAINEAMNAATAVIASDQCGAAADLIDETSGVVVAPGDAQMLAQALTGVLSDPDRCRAMGGAAARRIAEWNFDADLAGLRAALASPYVASSTRR